MDNMGAFSGTSEVTPQKWPPTVISLDLSQPKPRLEGSLPWHRRCTALLLTDGKQIVEAGVVCRGPAGPGGGDSHRPRRSDAVTLKSKQQVHQALSHQ